MVRLATQADLDARVLAAAKADVRIPVAPPATVIRQVLAKSVVVEEPAGSSEANESSPSGAATDEPDPPNWPDEASETAFLAGAQERGEIVTPAKPAEVPEVNEEVQPLPSLDSLVERIPAGVRDKLEELFRAKFVRVQRVPRRALKK